MGRWIYVTNADGTLTPADTPPDFYPNDPLSVIFQNGWTNIADSQAVSYRLFPSTKLEIRGSFDGGTVPSVIFTLPDSPSNLRPALPVATQFSSLDGATSYTGRIDPNGDVWVLVATETGGGGGGGISEVSSTDGSVEVTNPTGPTVYLEVPSPAAFIQRETLTATFTVPSDSEIEVSWSAESGFDLVDLTTPTAPAFLYGDTFYLIYVMVTNPLNFEGEADYANVFLTDSVYGAQVAAGLVDIDAPAPSGTTLAYASPYNEGDTISVNVSNSGSSGEASLTARMTIASIA